MHIGVVLVGIILLTYSGVCSDHLTRLLNCTSGYSGVPGPTHTLDTNLMHTNNSSANLEQAVQNQCFTYALIVRLLAVLVIWRLSWHVNHTGHARICALISLSLSDSLASSDSGCREKQKHRMYPIATQNEIVAA
jgi:hypothetical protein